jgi:hypothetical protein
MPAAGVDAGVGAGVVVRYFFQALRFAASASKAAFLSGGILLVFDGA